MCGGPRGKATCFERCERFCRERVRKIPTSDLWTAVASPTRHRFSWMSVRTTHRDVIHVHRFGDAALFDTIAQVAMEVFAIDDAPDAAWKGGGRCRITGAEQ